MLRLVVATSLLVLVAGCTDPEPKEPKPTKSATPTASAPTMPAQAKEKSNEGAAAFVGYYVEVLNYAAATGDVTELSRLSDPACSGCQSYIKLYRDTYAAGGYFKGGKWRLSRVEVEGLRSPWRVFGHLDAQAGTQAANDTEEPGPTSPENAELVFSVATSDESSLMLRLARAEK